jgi:hypothetical protein
MTARLRGHPWFDQGREGRNIRIISVGDALSLDTGAFPTEVKDARGRWRRVPGPAVGTMPDDYGWLSYADDRVARWDAKPVVLHIVCKGAAEWLPCAGGGERSCQRCDQVMVFFEDVDLNFISTSGELPRTGMNAPEIGVRRVATCRDPCPPHPDSPDIIRLRQLNKRVDLWREGKRPAADVASLYTSRADCLREHPPRHRPRPSDE